MEKCAQKADLNLKLKVLGGLSVFGLLNYFLNTKPDQGKDKKPDIKVDTIPVNKNEIVDPMKSEGLGLLSNDNSNLQLDIP